MRLLRTSYDNKREPDKLQTIQVWGANVPRYAILSHQWAQDNEEEVTLVDIQYSSYASKPQYSKIAKAMQQARQDGLDYIWIDTCCIDKTSSVELGEAINSMYRYYQEAVVCYAYIADHSSSDPIAHFAESRWFLRGWTLQELLAPQEVEFFTSDWVSIGSKFEMARGLADITRIDIEYLTHVRSIYLASIAKRMSWAAKRNVTREEDIAYCLLGIFDISMVMLYGEGGKKAFIRLQEEILKQTEDHSIFAWTKSDDDAPVLGEFHGLLADSPRDFRNSSSIRPYSEAEDSEPITQTPRGLKVSFRLLHHLKDEGSVLAALNCPAPGRNYEANLAIRLQRLPNTKNQYGRIQFCTTLRTVSTQSPSKEVYVPQQFARVYDQNTMYQGHFFQLRNLSSSPDPLVEHDAGGWQLISVASFSKVLPNWEGSYYAKPRREFKISPMYKITKRPQHLAAAIHVRNSNLNRDFVLLLGSISETKVGFDVTASNALTAGKNVDSKERYEAFTYHFTPMPAGIWMAIDGLSVQVLTSEQIVNGSKIYLVDIRILPNVIDGQSDPGSTGATIDAARLITNDDQSNGIKSKLTKMFSNRGQS